MTSSENQIIPDRRSSPEMSLALAELGSILHADLALTPHLQRVAEIAAGLMAHVRDVSVTLLSDPGERRSTQDKVRSVAFTGPLALRLDERQYSLGYGPCVDAALSGVTIHVETALDELYPEFSAQCLEAGVSHVVAFGMPVPGRTVGALNVYADAPFSDDDLVAGLTFAGYAGVALANALLLESAANDAHHLSLAMESRAVIEQAKGLVMASLHCTPDEAFDVLRKRSQHSNVKLRDLCRELVEAAAHPPVSAALTLQQTHVGTRTAPRS